MRCRKEINDALSVRMLGLEFFGHADADELALSVLEQWCLTKHNGMSRRLDGLSVSTKVSKVIEWAIKKAKNAVIAEDWQQLRKRRYAKPLRVRWLVCREGPVNLYSLSQGELPSSDIYCVSDSLIHESSSLKVNRLPLTNLETIRRMAGRKPQKAVEFVSTFANYLDARGGKTTINREKYMKVFLGYDNPTQWTRYKTIGEKAGVFRLTRGSEKGVRSNEYELTIKLRDGATIDETEPQGAA